MKELPLWSMALGVLSIILMGAAMYLPDFGVRINVNMIIFLSLACSMASFHVGFIALYMEKKLKEWGAVPVAAGIVCSFLNLSFIITGIVAATVAERLA